MKDCAAIQKHFSEYIDDRLEGNLRSVVEEHLHRCPACKEELDELRGMVGRVRGLPEARAPRTFVSRLNRRLEPSSGFQKILRALSFPLRFRIPFGFATATAMAVVIIFIIQMEQPHKSITAPENEMQSIRKLESRSAPEEKSVKLPAAADYLAQPPAVLPAPSSAVHQQAAPKEMLQEDRALAKKPKGSGMATAPSPVEGGPQNLLKWELRVSRTVDDIPDEKLHQEHRKAKGQPLAGRGDFLGVEREEVVTVMDEDSAGKDDAILGQYGSMDKTVKDLETLANRLGGKVISVMQNQPPSPEYVVAVTMPSEKVKAFYLEIRDLGIINAHPEAFSLLPKAPIKIYLKLISM